MLVEILSFAVFAALGSWLQRRPRGALVRAWLWRANIALVIPAAAVYALLGVSLDRTLLAVIGCGVLAWWLTVGAAAGYARLVSAAPGTERGALTLIGAFPNTGFVGFPLTLLVFGDAGLRTAVLYDQISLVVPAIVVAAIIARRAAAHEDPAADAADRKLVRELVLSPPLWAVAGTLLVRLVWVRDPVDLELLGQVVGHVVGPIGFALLGLSVPLAGWRVARGDALRITGAACIRLLLAPLAVVLVARGTGTDVPAALVFVAGMPVAFHTLIVSRIHDTRPDLVRFGVLVTTVVSIVVITPIAARFG